MFTTATLCHLTNGFANNTKISNTALRSIFSRDAADWAFSVLEYSHSPGSNQSEFSSDISWLVILHRMDCLINNFRGRHLLRRRYYI